MQLQKTTRLSRSRKSTSFQPVFRAGAKLISVIFHPLFIPVYISWFLIYYTPLFPQFTQDDKLLLLLRFLIMYTVFPLVTILLAKGLGFVKSIYLRTQKDRIIPYVACGIYYFWMWYVLRNQPEFPRLLVMLSMSIFIAASLGLIFNSYLKISMHTIAAGVMAAFVYSIALFSDANFGVYISIAFFIAGAVGTARLINGDHTPAEIYAGFFIGAVSLLIAYWIVM
ncbi:MAG: phosphatase PAP2 family protein [Chitinophagaceae bacterium]